MRKVIQTFILIFCSSILLVQHASGQRFSPLFQYMSSNSVLNRPEVLREIQHNIENETNNTKPGLNVDILYKKISELRDKLINKTQIKLSTAPSNEIQIEVEFAGNKISGAPIIIKDATYNSKTIRQVRDILETELSLRLTTLTTNTLQNIKQESTKKAIKSAVVSALKGLALFERSEFDESNFELVISRIFMEQMTNALQNKLQINDFNIGVTTWLDVKAKLIANINIVTDDH